MSELLRSSVGVLYLFSLSLARLIIRNNGIQILSAVMIKLQCCHTIALLSPMQSLFC